MSELPETLKAWAANLYATKGMTVAPGLMRQAADRIEKLEAVFISARRIVRYCQLEPDCCPSLTLAAMIEDMSTSVMKADLGSVPECRETERNHDVSAPLEPSGGKM